MRFVVLITVIAAGIPLCRGQTGVNTCEYRGVQYLQGQQWYHLCDLKCQCVDASQNKSDCHIRCNIFDAPNYCRRVPDPQDPACCTIPECPTPAGLTVPCEDKIDNCDAYTSACSDRDNLQWAMTYCARSCHLCYLLYTRTPSTTTPVPKHNFCQYNGLQYQQGWRWHDGCKYTCECLDAAAGKYQCDSRCKQYNISNPSCRMVVDPRDVCCKVPQCDNVIG